VYEASRWGGWSAGQIAAYTMRALALEFLQVATGRVGTASWPTVEVIERAEPLHRPTARFMSR
jgi:hypothetical protein